MDVGFAAMEASSTGIDTLPDVATPSHSAKSQVLASASRIPTLSPGAARDRRQTLLRYYSALEELQNAVADVSGVWKNFETAKFTCNIAPAANILRLQDMIDETMDAQTLAQTNPQGWQRVKNVMKAVFVATSPFAKVLLLVAKQHSLVHSSLFSLFNSRVASKSI
jgi:hypothetical protein